MGGKGEGSHPDVPVRAQQQAQGIPSLGLSHQMMNKAWWSWAGGREWTGQDNGLQNEQVCARNRTKAAMPCTYSVKQAPGRDQGGCSRSVAWEDR